MSDICDGSVFRFLADTDNFLSDKNNLALALSTDGVPVFKSSKLSLWPVYLTILNLPVNLSIRAHNIILCGLWAGSNGPLMSQLLKPVVNTLEQLYKVGILINTSAGTVLVRAKLVFGVFDLPAKAKVLCGKQFNGKFGCSVCLHPGKRLPNNSRVYLPDKYPERFHSQVIADGEAVVRGMYGVSPLAFMIDLVDGVPVDYMHCVLEGVTRRLIKSWFDKSHHRNSYYIGSHVKTIDEALVKLQPPHEFSRPPRSISKDLS